MTVNCEVHCWGRRDRYRACGIRRPPTLHRFVFKMETEAAARSPTHSVGTRAYLEVRRGERRSDNEGIRLKANRCYFGTSARALTGDALEFNIIRGVQTRVNILLWGSLSRLAKFSI